MGIGVEIAKLQQLLQPGDHAGADQGGWIEVAGLQGLALLQLRAVDPLGGEHVLAGEQALHARHHHLRLAGKQVGKPLGVVGLEPVIDLLKQGGAEFIDDVAQSEAQVEGQEGSCQHPQQADDHQIAPQNRGQIRALHLDGHPVSIDQLGFVHLPQAGGGHRIVGELLEQFVGRCPQLPLDGGQGDGVGEGGQVVLQLGELLQPVAPHQVGAGGEGLAHLDEAGAELGEGGEDAPAQLLLHPGVVAAALHHQHQGQAAQLPEHHRQPAHQHPGAQQQPAQITARVVARPAGGFGDGHRQGSQLIGRL